jgi:hypothetical protein
MTFIEGLAGLQDAAAPKEAQKDRPKINWLSVKNGETVVIQPLQELDPNSPNYNEERGLAYVTWYHQSPYDWQRQGLCTKDEGQCLPCELNNVDLITEGPEKGKPKTWYPKKRFYINVLVIPQDGADPYVAAFHCSTTGQGILPALLEWYNANGPITDTVFSLSRKGEKRDTSYTLTPRLKDEPLDLTGYTPEDTRAGGYPKVKYESQAKFFAYPGKGAIAEFASAVPQSAATIDW